MSETPEGEQTPAQPVEPAQPPAAQPPTQQPQDSAASAPLAKASAPAFATKRGTARSIHYNLSYVVANEAAGPRGAIVLLHDLPGGAFVWDSVMPMLAATGHAVYAFDMLGYGQSDH